MSLLAFAGGVKSLLGSGGGKSKAPDDPYGGKFAVVLEQWKSGVGTPFSPQYTETFRRKMNELQGVTGVVEFGSEAQSGQSTANKFIGGGGSMLSSLPQWAYAVIAVVLAGAVYLFTKKKRRR
jgi:hypothetical protein